MGGVVTDPGLLMKRLVTGLLAMAVGAVDADQRVVAGAESTASAPTNEFQFARLAYRSGRFDNLGSVAGRGRRGYGRGGSDMEPYLTDWPEAETFFLEGVRRLTRLDAAPEGRIIALDDDALFDYPVLYAVEVGYWNLTDADATRLREYLLRGGFLITDDFHGTVEWASFMDSMRRVFPDRPVVELEDTHEVLHTLFDVDERVQIPGIWALMSGVSHERDGYTPHWRGIYDDRGNLMVAINFNMDLGDAWEHADWPEYPENLTALAYRFGINYVIYAMTH